MRITFQHQCQKLGKTYLVLSFMLISFALLAPFGAFSQSNYKTPVVPPSPSSAVYAKYGDNQPSLHTGTVNIPISLLEVKASGFSFPLTATYQTSGINVSDIPYPLGYGWVFSSGFRITRTILGRPDERYKFRVLSGGEDYQDVKPGIVSNQISNIHQLNDTALFDTQKDIFTIHLPSGSHRFFVKKIAGVYQAETIGHQIKIEILAGFTGFKVTDSDGVIYRFGTDNPSIVHEFTEPTEFNAPSTWIMREIELLNGEKITFTWQRVNVNAYSVKTNTPITILDQRDINCTASVHEVIDNGGVIDHYSYSGANALMLKKIEYPNGTVDLTYKSANDPFLQTIIGKNKRNEIVKTISFTYGPNNIAGDHLLLQSLTVNADTYNFEYNSNRFFPLTTALDYWGFYNGKETNSTLLPKMKLQVHQGTNPYNPAQRLSLNIEVGHADRSVSAEHMKAFMLKKIIYPTKGYSEYEYEPHAFPGQAVHSSGLFQIYPDSLRMGGGLRVSTIRSLTSIGETPLIRTYKYGTNENGLANISATPTLETFIDEFWQADESLYCEHPGTYTFPTQRVMSINALSNYSKFLIDKDPIWYSKVTEYVNSEHKTEYTYSFNNAYELDWQLTADVVKSPYAFSYSNLFNQGPLLITNTVFKKAGSIYTPIKKVENQYVAVNDITRVISNATIDRRGIFVHSTLPGPDLHPFSSYPTGSVNYPASMNYNILPYTIAVQFSRLDKTITTNYENGQEMLSNVNYYYSDPLSSKLVKMSKSASIPGKDVSSEYKYADDLTAPIYQDMALKNRLAQVIEEKTTVGTTVVKQQRTNFSNLSAITTGLTLPVSVETAFAGSFTTEITYDKYDSRGNILQSSIPGGAATSYIWSYNRQYVVAMVVNASHSNVETLLGGPTSVNSFSSSNPSDVDIATFLTPLRAALPNALVTIYTHKPLVGLTSQTDPKGMTTYYEYDSFNRLQNIKDHNGNIVKNYAYNYAGSAAVTPVTSYQSQAKSQSFTKNNCPSGQNGTSVTYMVSAGKYSSTISPADADAKAQNEINLYGQQNANLLGGCSTGTTTYQSAALSVTRTRNNCAVGQNGSAVVFNAVLGAYTSTISQQDADQKALDAAQANANALGTCSAGTTTYQSAALSVTRTKNNCPAGQNGSAVAFNAGLGAYTSTISQQDADQKALDAAQANANSLGSCSIPGSYPNPEFVIYRTKNNCPAGLVSVASIPYTVPAGTYTSTISLDDAKIQAEAMLSSTAQNTANSIGTCASTQGTFTLNFVAPQTMHFEVIIKDPLGNIIAQPIFIGSHTVPNIPGGTGSITVQTWNSPSTPLTFNANLNGSVQTVLPAQFNNVSLTGTVNLTMVQTKFVNAFKTVSRTRNNCGSGYIGSAVNYPVAYGTHISYISQADADQLATNDINANAQAHANANGTCTVQPVYYNTARSITLQKSCSVGQVGSSVTYTVPAAKHSSIYSQADADQKALQDENANAQAYANSNGTCTIPTFTLNYSVPDFQQFALTITNLDTNTPVNYIITGTGTLNNVPAGGSNFFFRQTSQSAINGLSYTFSLNGYQYSGEYFLAAPQLSGTVQFNVVANQTVYKNVALSVSRTKNDCTSGQIGTAVTYSVPANKYASVFSQIHANQMAQDDVDANAQNYANTNGTCQQVYYNTALSVAKTRNNCTVGYIGGQAFYYVSYGKYSSMISQADADAKAQADVDANAQNHANTYATCTAPVTYSNTYTYGLLKKNDCPPGQIGGSPVYYHVTAGKHTSTISQADANAKAQADIAANAQNYANANGTCIASTFSISYNIPTGTQFQVRIVNYTNGTDVNYTTTGATGVFSNIPVGYVSISVKELNGTVGYYFLLNGQLQTEKVSEAVLSPYMSPTGLQTLYVTETNE